MNSILKSLDKKLGKNLSVRRHSLPELISESYKVFYDCEKDTNLQKLAESHLEDLRKNPMETERLSRQLSIVKEVAKLVESGDINDKDLEAATDSQYEGDVEKEVEKDREERLAPTEEIKESSHDEDVEDILDESKDDENVSEEDDEDLLEDTDLTDEEVEELTKHLSEIRKAKKIAECNAKAVAESTGRKLKAKSRGVDEARDFEWNDSLWAVVKEDGSYAGIPCTSEGEARDLAAQHDGSRIFKLNISADESKTYESLNLSEFSKNSSNKAFIKTFKKLNKKLQEGTALTRQESIALYKAANSAMTHLSVELEHNPEFLSTFKESVSLLSEDVNKVLGSLKEGKAPSKATMKSLAKFAETLLREEKEEEETLIEDEEDVVIDAEGDINSDAEETFDQEYADARVELHKELAEEHADDESPEVQEKLAQDAEEVASLPGITDEQMAELEALGSEPPAPEEAEGEEEVEVSDEEIEVEDTDESKEADEEEEEVELKIDDEEITDDELAELKKYLKEMREAKRK